MDSDYTIDIVIDEPFVALVDGDNIAAVVRATLQNQAVNHAEISLVITDDGTIHELNRTYRSVDAPTDVLSFSSREMDDETQVLVDAPPELAALLNAQLGDVIIAYPYAARQARRFGNSAAAELRLLAVHGTLHLLGYDHDTPDAEAEMWTRQEEILRAFDDQALTRRTYTIA